MAKKARSVRVERRYGVSFRVPYRPLGNSDVKFVVSDREGKIGNLLISRGAIEWAPYRKKRAMRQRKMTWERFDYLWSKYLDAE